MDVTDDPEALVIKTHSEALAAVGRWLSGQDVRTSL